MNLQQADVTPHVVLAAIRSLCEGQEFVLDGVQFLGKGAHLLLLVVQLGVKMTELARIFPDLKM